MSKKSNRIESAPQGEARFPLQKINYILIGVGLGIILLGLLLMMGGGSDDPNVFSEEIFSFRRITLAPILMVLGFVFEIVAIMYTPRKRAS